MIEATVVAEGSHGHPRWFNEALTQRLRGTDEPSVKSERRASCARNSHGMPPLKNVLWRIKIVLIVERTCLLRRILQ
jgi:hypothetical protein